MHTSNQNGKHINKAPKGYIIVKTSNGTIIKKAPPQPKKKNFIQKLLGL